MVSEVRTDQKILIRHEGKQYLGWENISMGRNLHEDISAPGAPEGFYFRLNFKGDLARGIPLPKDAVVDRHMHGEGLFNSQVVCVASYLNFFVTMKGEPAVGAKVVRMAEHVGYGAYEQSKLTDRDGEVTLLEIHASRLEYRWAKTEIKQKIVITYQGKEYLAWEKTKTNPWENGEFNLDDTKYRLPAEITAELSDAPDLIRGMKTDPERCGIDDNLPENAVLYKGLFQVTRFNPHFVIEEEQGQ